MTDSEDSGDSDDEQGEHIVNLSELTNNLTRTPLALSRILKTVRIGCSKIASFHPMILSMFSAQLLTENRFFICLRSIYVSRTHSSQKRTECELFREILNNAVHEIYTFCYPRGFRELWACWYSPKSGISRHCVRSCLTSLVWELPGTLITSWRQLKHDNLHNVLTSKFSTRQ